MPDDRQQLCLTGTKNGEELQVNNSTELEQFLKLQNGSDIRGVACEGIEGEEVNLTQDAAEKIGRAFVDWFAEKWDKKPEECTIGVGRDSRITGPDIMEAFMKGLSEAGVTVCDCGMASTPAMFMSIVYPETDFDAGCMITASHLPFNRNGIKFFDEEGGLEKADIKDVLTRAAGIKEPAKALKKPEHFDLIPLYREKLAEKIREGVNASDYRHPLAGLHVVVDAGNGAGGFFAELLKELGADTSGSRYLDPDGMFPNHIPNPENKEAMAAIVEATTQNHADLGLIFDTDVDRMSAVLSDGTPINRDSIIAMMAAILAPDYPGSTIITDSVTSDRLTDFLEKNLHLKHLRFKRGYKNVIDKCKELNKEGIVSPLAMETSGHGCLKENYYLDDGAYLAVKLLIAVANEAKSGRTIDHLISGLSMTYKDREVRFAIHMDDFQEYGKYVQELFHDRALQAGYQIQDSYEGIRLRFTGKVQGWLLLRASLHDPVMVLNMEGRTGEDLEMISDIAGDLLAGMSGLDLSAL